MAPSMLSVVAAAAGVTSHLILSPIPEVSTIKVILAYLCANIILGSYLVIQGGSVRSPLKNIIVTTSQSFTLNAIFLSAGIGLTLIRRIFFSPISHIPGPLLARLSKLWEANEYLHGRTAKTRKELHKKYNSDFVRVGPNEISIRCVEALEKIYKAQYPRGPFNEIGKMIGARGLSTQTDYKIHHQWRRVW
jgi:hypothetical protein